MSCFHDTKRVQLHLPPEVEGVRRTIHGLISEVPLPVILEGNLAFWQWDRWDFCAGYEYKFKDMEEIKLLGVNHLRNLRGQSPRSIVAVTDLPTYSQLLLKKQDRAPNLANAQDL